MSYHSRAPVRIDLAGGWSDVPAFTSIEEGAVVNAAISLFVYVEVRMGGKKIRFHSDDTKEHVALNSPANIVYDGTLDLHKAALNMFPVTGGIEILSRSDVPPGSGLGASAALDVALVATLARCREESYDPIELAEMGFLLETSELRLQGGRQDQYAAALGGVNELRFAGEDVTVRKIELDNSACRDLERHILIVYTGESHFSSRTHAYVWEAFESGDQRVTVALRNIRDLAGEAAEAIRDGSWERVARAVDANWSQQQLLHASISTNATRKIEAAARDAGAWGLKAAGAGAGGSLMILAPPERRSAITRAVEEQGGRVLDFEINQFGLQTWEEENAGGDDS